MNLMKSLNKRLINLSEFGVNVPAPKIVVTGSQSTGKSTLLELIMGIDILPKGRGTITKCPIVLNFMNTEEETFVEFFNEKKKYSVLEAKNKISEIMKKIEKISDDEIRLKVYKKDCLEIILVDLPGFIHFDYNIDPDFNKYLLKSKENYPNFVCGSKKILINRLVEKYLQVENFIILNLINSTTDVATCDSLNLLRKYDRNFERTVIVLTKIDLIKDVNELFEIINNKNFENYLYGVSNCEMNDIEMKIKNSKLKRDDKIKLAEHLGLKNLEKKLSTIFEKKLQNKIPEIKREISEYKKKNQFLNIIDVKAKNPKEIVEEYISNFLSIFEKSKVNNKIFKTTTVKGEFSEFELNLDQIFQCKENMIEKNIGPIFLFSTDTFKSVIRNIIKPVDYLIQDKIDNLEKKLLFIANDLKTEIYPNLDNYFKNKMIDFLKKNFTLLRSFLKTFISIEIDCINLSHKSVSSGISTLLEEIYGQKSSENSSRLISFFPKKQQSNFSDENISKKILVKYANNYLEFIKEKIGDSFAKNLNYFIINNMNSTLFFDLCNYISGEDSLKFADGVSEKIEIENKLQSRIEEALLLLEKL